MALDLGVLALVPAPFVVMALAFSPLGEVRLAVPVAVLQYGMGWAEAFVWSLAGNLLVLPVAAWTYPRLEALLRRWGRAGRLLDRIEARMRRRSGRRVERYEEAAVGAVIAVPLPASGAWTGVLVAHFFGLPWRKVAPAYCVGCVAATAIAVALVEAGLLAFPFFYGT